MPLLKMEADISGDVVIYCSGRLVFGLRVVNDNDAFKPFPRLTRPLRRTRKPAGSAKDDSLPFA